MDNLTDWRDLDLGMERRTLVEASAGTGKTWTIGVLYLRTLLEQGLTPRQVVIATYTNPAAAELKERLRSRIEDTLSLARAGGPLDPHDDESDKCWLRDRWSDANTRDLDINQLSLALSELDLAPITTLHGLCMRILGEHPFAAGSTLRAPTLVDSSNLVHELADDFWRGIHAGEADTAGTMNWPSRRDLPKVVKVLLQPKVRVTVPNANLSDTYFSWAPRLSSLVARKDVFARANSALRARWAEIAAVLADWDEEGGLEELKGLKDPLEPLGEFIEEGKQIKEPFHDDPAVQEAVTMTQALMSDVEKVRAARKAEAFAAIQTWSRSQLNRRLSSAGQLGFDDLLTTVETALQPKSDGRRELADALFASWPVAMIDEFQDTDPVQFGILDAVYRDGDGGLRGHLLLIGDPKQAIYRFRGGDIHTYERAKSATTEGNRLTLSVNRRSSTRYVHAVNGFYGAVGTKLGLPASTTPIHYVEALPSPQADDSPLVDADGHDMSGLILHHPGTADEDSPPDSGREFDEHGALASCADQIVTMLATPSSLNIAGNPLSPGDICVLVPSHRHSDAMLAALRKLGVPCVNRGRASVFHSDTAKDLLVILDAVVRCDDPRRVRAALATGLWGMGYHELRSLREDIARSQSVVQTFRRWHQQWLAHGVLAVVTDFMHRIAGDRLGAVGADRVFTDLRHLGELLQAHAAEADGPESVLVWLNRQITEGTDDEEEVDARALRMESDARCVQVMTLHSSKGLEFPVVMLPLMWKHGRGQEDSVNLLAGENGARDVVFDKERTDAVEMEKLDERFRVLYVALTRARYACHVWLPPAEAVKNELLSAPLTLRQGAMEPWLEGRETPPRGVTVSSPWPSGNGRILDPEGVSSPDRHVRPEPPPRKGPLPSRHSFTTLTHRPRQFEPDPWASANDESDVEELSLNPEGVPTTTSQTPHAALTELRRIAGAEFGNAVHAILELHAKGTPIPEQMPLVRRQLAQNNVRLQELDEERFTSMLAERLQGVLAADLDGHGLRLAAIPPSDQRHEMEFNFALDSVSLRSLRNACAASGYPDLAPQRHGELAGLMNGKIDLIFRHDGRFHVLDWKGNRIGSHDDDCLEEYAPSSVAAKMDAAHYRFQALLYTVALERYLQTRLGASYERSRHLGDCWYLFIRAVGLTLPDGSPCGIWRHRFSDMLLDAVQQVFSSRHEEVAA